MGARKQGLETELNWRGDKMKWEQTQYLTLNQQISNAWTKYYTWFVQQSQPTKQTTLFKAEYSGEFMTHLVSDGRSGVCTRRASQQRSCDSLDLRK